MFMLNKGLTLFFLAVALTACKYSPGGSAGTGGQPTAPVDTVLPLEADTAQVFRLPDIPVVLSTPEQRAEFLASHYWDCLGTADTGVLLHSEALEQAWANYCDLLRHVPLPVARQAIKELFSSLESDMKLYVHFKSLAESYLDDPNSPLRNEDIYISVLEAMVSSDRLGDMDKLRPRARLKLALKNRPGGEAEDFTYTLATGERGTLHRIPAEYILLFFNEPGCETCAAAMDGLKSVDGVTRLVGQGRLAVLLMYIDDDLAEWNRHRPDFPDTWINGYDAAQLIRKRQLYDVRATPSLYLLDKDKKVLLKDASLQEILAFLENRAG